LRKAISLLLHLLAESLLLRLLYLRSLKGVLVGRMMNLRRTLVKESERHLQSHHLLLPLLKTMRLMMMRKIRMSQWT